MNITRLNFKEALPFILSSLKEANFIATDLEMSGIFSTPKSDPSLTDSMQIRYSKIKSKIQKFIPVQLGLCTVQCNSKQVIYSPFNIYIYPLSLSERDAQEFAFNSESMRFLSQNKFDFNKLFYQGIPYINASKINKQSIRSAEILRKQQISLQYFMNSPQVIAYMKMRKDQVVQWIGNPQNRELYIDVQFVKMRVYSALMQYISENYPSLSLKYEYTDSNKNILMDSNNFLQRKYLKISKIVHDSQGSQSAVKFTKADHEQSLLLNLIWSEIKERKIPLLVHNGYLDLMHIYHRFIDQLPDSQIEYRQKLHEYFPTVIDTKYICNTNAVILNKLNRNTGLSNCYSIFRSMGMDVDMGIHPDCSGYHFDQLEQHEAGFDSLMTAYTFINAMKMMEKSPGQLIEENFQKSSQFFINKIPLGNIRVPYNLRTSTDEYSKDGCEYSFQFTLLKSIKSIETPQSLNSHESSIIRHFAVKYGPVRLIWAGRDSFDFTINFIREEDETKFVDSAINKGGHGLYALGEKQYLVSQIDNRIP